MSAWSEAVWVQKKIASTLTTIQTQTDKIPNLINSATNALNSLSTIISQLNNTDHGLEAIAELAAKKGMVLTTNSGTASEPVPENVDSANVADGALFFIQEN